MPHKSTSSNSKKKWLKRHGERRKDKGDGGGSIILKVVCEELCVTQLCVTKLCVKDCVLDKVVCDKVVCDKDVCV